MAVAGEREGRRVNRVSVSKCAQCGADMIAPEWSEHVSDRRVRNFWSCEVCGYRFEDTVYFSAPEFGGASMTGSADGTESARLPAMACGDHP
jgi:ribosomal protein L37AE/L43A